MKPQRNPEPVVSLFNHFVEIRHRLRELKLEEDALCRQIKPILIRAGGEVTAGNVTLTVAECERESIRLKAAKAKLGKLLQPFITLSKYRQIREKK